MDSSLRTLEADKTEKAKKVGELLAQRAKEAGITAVVFDRGGNRYAGASPRWRTAPAKVGSSSDAGEMATEKRNH